MKRNLLFGIVIGLVFFALAFVFVARPWYLRWGATDAEIAMSLPGDVFTKKNPTALSTRAITIKAPAAVVWQWLVQTGQGRGGFYSYDWLENLFAADMHNAERVTAELQDLKVGDWVLMHPMGATNKAMRGEVALLEPERSLVLSGGWGWYLEPIDVDTTRLIVRYPNYEDPIYYFMIFEQAHFIMESGMMLGLKARAEQVAPVEARSTIPVRTEGDDYAVR
jgi:hypothetical protein